MVLKLKKDAVLQHKPFAAHFQLQHSILHTTDLKTQAAYLERLEIGRHDSTNKTKGYNKIAGHPTGDARYWASGKFKKKKV